MDPLSFISKILDVTARVGAAVAIAALVVYVGRRTGIDFFVGVDTTLYQYIILGGIVGAALVGIDFVIVAAKAIRWLASKLLKLLSEAAKRRQKKLTALKNMGALAGEYAEVLRFLKSNNMKRFHAPTSDDVLILMLHAYLIEIDDPNWSFHSPATYYVVPNYIWDLIEPYLSKFPVPTQPPWIRPPDRNGWMRY